jgi:hypothetical protein
MKHLLQLILLVSVMPPASVGQETAVQSRPIKALAVPTVAFCDLLKNPQLYSGRVIRTSAIFRRGGEEIAEFYCPSCLESGRVYLDIDEGYETCTKPANAEKIRSFNTVDVTLTGRFVVAGPGVGFGHLGQWRQKLIVSCVEKASVISKYELSPDHLPGKVRRRATCK